MKITHPTARQLAIFFWYMFMALVLPRYQYCYRITSFSYLGIGQLSTSESALAVIVIVAFPTYALFGMLYKRISAGEFQSGGPYRYLAHPAYYYYHALDLVAYCSSEHTVANTSTFIAFHVAVALTCYFEERELIARFGNPARVMYACNISYYRFLSFLKRSLTKS